MKTAREILEELDQNDDNVDQQEIIMQDWAISIIDTCTEKVEKMVHAKYDGLEDIKQQL